MKSFLAFAFLCVCVLARHQVALQANEGASAFLLSMVEEREWEQFFAENKDLMTAEQLGFWQDAKATFSKWTADAKEFFKQKKCQMCQSAVRFVRDQGCDAVKDEFCGVIGRLLEGSFPASSLVAKGLEAGCGFVFDKFVKENCQAFVSRKTRGSAILQCSALLFCPAFDRKAQKEVEKWILPDICLTDEGAKIDPISTTAYNALQESLPPSPKADLLGTMENFDAFVEAKSESGLALERALEGEYASASTSHRAVARRSRLQSRAAVVIARFHISNTAVVKGGLTLSQRRALVDFALDTAEHIKARGFAVAVLANDIARARKVSASEVLGEISSLGAQGIVDWLKTRVFDGEALSKTLKGALDKIKATAAKLVERAQDAICETCQSSIRNIDAYGCSSLEKSACAMSCSGMAKALTLAGVPAIPGFMLGCKALCAPIIGQLKPKCEDVMKGIKEKFLTNDKGQVSIFAFCQKFPAEKFPMCGASQKPLPNECSRDVSLGTETFV